MEPVLAAPIWKETSTQIHIAGKRVVIFNKDGCPMAVLGVEQCSGENELAHNLKLRAEAPASEEYELKYQEMFGGDLVRDELKMDEIIVYDDQYGLKRTAVKLPRKNRETGEDCEPVYEAL